MVTATVIRAALRIDTENGLIVLPPGDGGGTGFLVYACDKRGHLNYNELAADFRRAIVGAGIDAK